MSEEPDYTDGNALAGPLAEVFAIDLTAAHTTCAACGQRGRIADLRVYGTAPGMVARCSSCGEVMLRYVRSPDAGWLDLRGIVALQMPLAADQEASG
jgi:hypothetical protein